MLERLGSVRVLARLAYVTLRGRNRSVTHR